MLKLCAAGSYATEVDDDPMLPNLLDQIATVTADGAFDTRKRHDAMRL